MKKILYGILILIGGSLIASNFMVDSSKLDHKRVSASGTTCKWISESGYGVGPYYIDKENNNISIINEVRIYPSSQSNGDIFSIFSCNSDNSGFKMDGNLLYNADKTLYDGYFGFFTTGISATAIDVSTVVKVDDGKMIFYGSEESDNVEISNINKELEFDFFNGIYITPYFGYASRRFSPSFSIKYDYDVNSDGKNMFTCVCAEY